MEANISYDTKTSNIYHALHTPMLNSSKKPSKVIIVTFASIVFLISMVALIINQSQNSFKKIEIIHVTNISSSIKLPRGVAQGVSAKSNLYNFHKVSYNWTNAMISWQRTAFHFQPQKNWMNGKCTLAYFLFYFYSNVKFLFAI